MTILESVEVPTILVSSDTQQSRFLATTVAAPQSHTADAQLDVSGSGLIACDQQAAAPVGRYAYPRYAAPRPLPREPFLVSVVLVQSYRYRTGPEVRLHAPTRRTGPSC